MTKSKIVVADDGSTACKLAYIDPTNPDQVITLISPNRAELGRGFSFGSVNHVYSVDEEGTTQYTFNELKNALPTNNKEFQYHPQSRASVQHALVMSGIKETDIDLCVTLPISQYYQKTGDENIANIESKKKAHLGFIRSENHQTYKINTVSVFPEGIPAMLLALEDRDILPTDTSMLIDIGGTTSDICIFSGKLENIINISSIECGMFEIMESIRSELTQSMNNIYTMHLDFVLRNFDNRDAINKQIHCDIDVMQHANQTLERLYRQLLPLNNGDFLNTNVYLTGGGANILGEFLKRYNIKSNIIAEPETALAKAILFIKNS